MSDVEKKADALRKQCFDACFGCRHGHPYDEATGIHTCRKAQTVCAAKAIRDALKATGCSTITEIGDEERDARRMT